MVLLQLQCAWLLTDNISVRLSPHRRPEPDLSFDSQSFNARDSTYWRHMHLPYLASGVPSSSRCSLLAASLPPVVYFLMRK
jgi:hypothetical protein